jgi:hypothetical protein
VTVGGTEVPLRAREFDLLSVLVRNAGEALTRERLMAEVWDENWFGSTKPSTCTSSRCVASSQQPACPANRHHPARARLPVRDP